MLLRLRHLLALAALAAATAHAEVFTFQDWAVACDNTRHCEAVGYEAEDGGSQPVALWLARDAGPDTPLVGMLAAVPAGAHARGALTLVAGKAGRATAGADDHLAPAALARLLPSLVEAGSAQVRLGDERFTLSLAGLKAALLKMDERQGRVGTPGALVRKGARPESSVLRPLPAPRLPAPPAVADRPGDEALLKTLVRKLKTDCDDSSTRPASAGNTTLHRVSASELVLVRDCQSGYNSPSDVWVVGDRPPYAAHPAAFDANATVDADAATTNATFDGQLLQASFKGRGLDDCASMATWLWTGKSFALAEAREAPLCRGLPAGGFSVRTWISQH